MRDLDANVNMMGRDLGFVKEHTSGSILLTSLAGWFKWLTEIVSELVEDGLPNMEIWIQSVGMNISDFGFPVQR